jgi:class 3 adenylate cyclase
VASRLTERRVLTALFVDVVGSTALTAAFGPERLKRTLDRAFTDLRAIIAAEGGTVEKFVGDAIHAVFGAPVAHGDDPQRALRAAHACLRWAGTQAGAPIPLDVRIGVETGEAIVDLGAVEADRQQMSVGTCVNVAARLQQLAAPGEALVGPTCHDLGRDLAEFEARGEVELRGVGRLPAWRLVALVAPRAGARLPFVGRDAERDLLRAAYRRAVSGRSVLALVLGPPGQGKTRLVEECLAEVQPRATVLSARCRPAGETGLRTPLRELLTGGASDVTMEDLGARVGRVLADPAHARRVVAALAHSAGLATSPDLLTRSTAERQDELTSGWRRYLSALARDRPVVVWVEDLHWAEAELVSLLDRLTLAAPIPLLVVATARPELAERAGLRPGGDRFFIEVGGLGSDEARALARHAGSRDDFDVARAEGNPLFIIELARAGASAPDASVPLTLQGLIGARLDELPSRDREFLQRVAVAGDRFGVTDAALLSGRGPADVADALERLSERLFLHPVAGGYRFHHALVRDVAYGRLPAAERLRLHARYAQEGLDPDDVEGRAHHLWLALGGADAAWVWADSEDLSRLRILAYESHLAAGRHYAGRFAIQSALDAYRRALEFAESAPARAAVEQAMGAAHAAEGRADEAWQHYMRARELYREGGEAPPAELYANLTELAVWTPGMFHRVPDDAEVSALLDEGEDRARRSGSSPVLAHLFAIRAHFGTRTARTFNLAPLEEGLRLVESAADLAPFGRFLVNAAGLQVRWGHFRAAARTFERLDDLGAAGHRIDQADEYRVAFALHTGDLSLAENLVEQFALENASRGPHLASHVHRERAHLLLARGDWPRLVALATTAEKLVADNPATAFCYAITTARALGAVACAMLGQRVEAEALLARAETRLTSLPFSHEEGLLLGYGVLGRRPEVARLADEIRARYGALLPHFFRRTQATVLTMFERWSDLAEPLAALDAAASQGSRFLAALATAIREELAARRGGPAATHAALRALGYRGWSTLLAWRPAP